MYTHAGQRGRNAQMQREMERLTREERMAMDAFQVATDADGEVDEEPEHLASCDFNGCESVELFEANVDLGADFAGQKACRRCINTTLEEREGSGECRDHREEVGG